MKLHDRLARYLAPILVAVALAVTLGYETQTIALRHTHNRKTFEAINLGLEGQPRPWRPRLFSNYLASRFVTPPPDDMPPEARDERFARGVRAWTVVWFLAIAAVLVGSMRERSLFFLLGTFAAVSYGYMPGITARIYPWDLPALFFFTVFTVAAVHRRFEWLLLIPLATGFKETSIVFAAAFLFWNGASWRKRLGFCIGTGLAAVAVKVGIALAVDNPSIFFTMSSRSGRRVLDNLAYFGRLGPLHPLLYDAGLLAAFLILPNRRPGMPMLKVVALLFIAGTFYYANIWEIRVWFELIPISLFGLALHFFPSLLAGTEREPGSPELAPAAGLQPPASTAP